MVSALQPLLVGLNLVSRGVHFVGARISRNCGPQAPSSSDVASGQCLDDRRELFLQVEIVSVPVLY
jgi:hypothetical protein